LVDTLLLDLFPGVSKKSDGWVGLGCCELAIAGECRRECKQVKYHVQLILEASTLMLYNWWMSHVIYFVLCCDREKCQEISTHWGSQTWQDFDQLCEYNPMEMELINCLADVREPCQLGCKDLTYCTNFNNRSGIFPHVEVD
ncbi:hypothetical protein XENOCAPTIV_004315, partial [Xenoophorus captivus]